MPRVPPGFVSRWRRHSVSGCLFSGLSWPSVWHWGSVCWSGWGWEGFSPCCRIRAGAMRNGLLECHQALQNCRHLHPSGRIYAILGRDLPVGAWRFSPAWKNSMALVSSSTARSRLRWTFLPRSNALRRRTHNPCVLADVEAQRSERWGASRSLSDTISMPRPRRGRGTHRQ
jgi:hypothetical protein